jgi:hypothetical protein
VRVRSAIILGEVISEKKQLGIIRHVNWVFGHLGDYLLVVYWPKEHVIIFIAEQQLFMYDE